jgi:hypothetical protein
MKTSLLCLLVALGATVLAAACAANDDDDSSADDDAVDDDVDDDAVDDDAVDDDVDDDAVDDDTVDDDAIDDDAVDDDAVDDDTIDDDAVDDDAIDDDSFQNAECENLFYCSGGDACETGLCRLYCFNRTPLIIDGVQIGQNYATAACEQAATPLWIDIRDCLESGEVLAQCLQDKGWPADYPDVFDATAWTPDQLGPLVNRYQALNLFAYIINDQTYLDRWELTGGIVDPDAPLLRLADQYVHAEFENYINVYAIGIDAVYSPVQISFGLHGFWIWFDMLGNWDFKLYSDVLTFVPVL